MGEDDEPVRGRILRRCGVALGLLLASLALTHDAFYSGDSVENYIQYRAFTDRNALFLDGYEEYLFRDWRNEQGRSYSVYGVGYPLLAAAFGKSLAAVGLENELDPVVVFKLPNTILFFLSAILLCRLLAAWGAGPANIVVAFVALTFSTQASDHCTSWSSNSFVASLVTIAFYFYVRATGGMQTRAEISNRDLVFAGIAIGYAGLSRSFPFLIAPAFALALLYELVRVRGCPPISKTVVNAELALSIPIVVAFGAQVGIDYVKLGSLQSTYAAGGFSTPFYVGFLGNLLWPGKSVLFFAPITALGAFSLHALYRQSPVQFFLALYILATYVIGYSKWDVWHSGPIIGNRYWLPALPFLIFPLAMTKNRGVMAAAILLVGFGTYTQVLMHHRNPRPIYKAIYRHFPGAERRDVVERVLSHDPLRVVKVTFVEGAFFKGLDSVNNSPPWRQRRGGRKVPGPGEPALATNHPPEPNG
jgi:hypothetical protein